MNAGHPMDSPSQPVLPELGGWRDLIVSGSLANLCLLKVWSLLLERGIFIPRTLYLAVFLNLTVLTAAIWSLLRFTRRSAGGPPPWVRGLLAGLFLVALHGFLTIVFLNSLHTRIRGVAYLAAAALSVSILASGPWRGGC